MRSIDRKPRREHRLIWEEAYGPIPSGMQIDHINGIRTDNRLENLRLATNQQNSSNRLIGKLTNIDIRCNGYRVKISFHRKTHYFGTYNDLELAQFIRDLAREKLNKEFCGRG